MTDISASEVLAMRQKGALHHETTARLREMIISGELAPGTKLREASYCEMFDISRTPLREALRTLAAEGLVELLPNRSAVVAKSTWGTCNISTEWLPPSRDWRADWPVRG